MGLRIARSSFNADQMRCDEIFWESGCYIDVHLLVYLSKTTGQLVENRDAEHVL